MILRRKPALWRRVMRFAGRQFFRWAENNDDGRLTHNGEGWFLRQLLAKHRATSGSRPFVVFDGGCNAGDYARVVLHEGTRLGSSVEVHAFEPSPRCLATLRKLFAGQPAVHIVAAGLADRKSEATLFAGDSGSGHASLVPREVLGAGLKDVVKVPLLRLDDYLREQKIECVDLLKLDVEGYELLALRGLGERLRPEIVDAIQFEYGGAALDAGTTLRALYQLLESRGFVIAKLFPRDLEVRPYRVWMEHYSYANYVALSPRWLTSARSAQ